MAISAEKAMNKIEHPFSKSKPSKLGIEGNFNNMMKSTYKKPIANMIVKKD